MKMAIGLLMVLSLSSVAPGAVADVKEPDALIRETADEVIATVKHDKDMRNGNQQKLLDLVEVKILPHFDFERLTRLAVGVPWRSATAEQRKALVTEFRTLLVRTYTAAFSRYQDQKVEVKPAVVNPKRKDEATVNTTIVKPGSPPIAVDYVMEKKDDGWKVFDLSIEGSSLIESYRGTFAEKTQESGIDGLIKYLADKNRANAAKPLNKADSK
jgi:phospholipid transport system substrate-binding protein